MTNSKAAPLAAPSSDLGFVWDGESTQWVSTQAASKHFDVELDDGRSLVQIPLCCIRAIKKAVAKPKAKKVLQGILRYTTACDVFASEKRDHSPDTTDTTAASTTTSTATSTPTSDTATTDTPPAAPHPSPRPPKREPPALTTPQKKRMRLRKNILGKTPKFPQWLAKRLEDYGDADERCFWRKHCEVGGGC